MSLKVELSDKVYWLGFNDRRKHLFENQWPLDKGVTYNAYLIDDEKTALIDTAEAPFSGDLVAWIKDLLGAKKLDYLIINHMEPDHSGSIKDVVTAFPEITIVGNRKTFPILEGFYGISKNIYEVAEGDILSLGKHQLQFFMIPMVHWPESMVTYDTTDKIIFSNDAFGSFGTLNGGVFDDEMDLTCFNEEIRRYYSNIVGKYGAQVQKALTKLETIEIKLIAPSHGLIWRSKIPYIVEKYHMWSKHEGEAGAVIVFGSMYGNTEKMADYIARFLIEEGVKFVKVYDSAKTHTSYIINDIWKYKGVVLGSCAYNGGIFPPMAHLLSDLEHYGLRERYLSVFGSSSWGGGGVRAINKFAENIKWELVGDQVEARCAPNESDIDRCRSIAKAMSLKLKALE
ncbi:MAG TPA: FprA family A-type flavoprotein [Marinilabiliales bacterium]|jgi:flavorubredoxin|nr:MAG: flavodoxin [Bacteroidetes bacterium GWA2_40_14]OFX59591.1 MAG: flavodoxin [Bacteroidetes bacterium GWC2_40_13]OFX72988.1 MAG: flavodoxin [Bacteroidetes bacterium GWD2_40_43]OFX92618.1 MAG: flavodoxin [Bacteroidetes bacterium GWE2_40_63]OFY17475.1 MAG: flavodoxin [Bacteroidetes bacterium GWF2_40_13]HAM97246.1 FprA family A-type flavoprotein [Marinilabiliales bacterium]